jgi:hypothetical protein
MSDEWLFKSETYDNCNCAVNCGRQFNITVHRADVRKTFDVV